MLYARVRPPAPCPARRACQTQRLAACSLRAPCFTFAAHTRGGGRWVAVTRAKKLGQGASTRSVNAQVNTGLNLVKAEHRNGPNRKAREPRP